MTENRSALDAAGASRLDAVVGGSRVISAWRAAIASPARALESGQLRRLAAPVLDLDAPSRWRAAGITVIVAVITHTVALAVLGVPVHLLGWTMRAGVFAGGVFVSRHQLAVAAAWKERTGERPRSG